MSSAMKQSDSKHTQPLSIIIPVYNEGVNFPNLWVHVCSQIHSPFRALVIYDFVEDDTLAAVQKIISEGEGRLELVKNAIRPGVVGAILTGFNQIEDGPVLVMMADLCDDLTQVDLMLSLYKQGY